MKKEKEILNQDSISWNLSKPTRSDMSIDYQCDDGYIPVSASCVRISKPDLPYSLG
jgi:hypothetical protein